MGSRKEHEKERTHNKTKEKADKKRQATDDPNAAIDNLSDISIQRIYRNHSSQTLEAFKLIRFHRQAAVSGLEKLKKDMVLWFNLA